MLLFNKSSELKEYLDKLNSSVGSIFKFDTTRASSICWLNSLKRPTYLQESIFVDLFSFHNEVEELIVNAGDPKLTGSRNRIETISTLTRSSTMMIKDSTAVIVLEQMFNILLITGNIFRTCNPSVAFDSLPPSTSSSFPDFKSPKTIVRNKIISQAGSLLRYCDFNLLKFPICINWRTQVSSSHALKFRQFFPLPGLINCVERMLFNGIFLHFERNKDTPYCFGNTYMDIRRRYIMWQKYKKIYSLDFKAFDTKVSNDLILLVLTSLVKRIRLNTREKELALFVIEYHLNCSLISSKNGKPCLFTKVRGLMSGSSLTNLLGSIINLFMILYLNKEYNLDIHINSISVMGDDIVFCSNKSFTIEYFSSIYKKHFAMDVSLNKSEVFLPGEKVYFLGHKIDDNGRYLDIFKTKLQLCISENYIPESVLSTNDRIWSKFCSICFKCSDGNQFFMDKEKALMILLKTAKPIGHYYSLFNNDGNPRNRLNFNEYRVNGWRLQ